jgi:hypothetical protein
MKNYVNKTITRLGGIIYSNIKRQNHRLDGPAVMYPDGYKEWWLNNRRYTKFKHNRLALFYVLEHQQMG